MDDIKKIMAVLLRGVVMQARAGEKRVRPLKGVPRQLSRIGSTTMCEAQESHCKQGVEGPSALHDRKQNRKIRRR